jgi:hypothetical protein
MERKHIFCCRGWAARMVHNVSVFTSGPYMIIKAQITNILAIRLPSPHTGKQLYWLFLWKNRFPSPPPPDWTLGYSFFNRCFKLYSFAETCVLYRFCTVLRVLEIPGHLWRLSSLLHVLHVINCLTNGCLVLGFLRFLLDESVYIYINITHA